MIGFESFGFEGFGSEVSLLTIIILITKIVRDKMKEKRELKIFKALSNPGGKGETSVNIIEYRLRKHGDQLDKIQEEQTEMKVDIRECLIVCRAVIKAKLKIGDV